MRSFIIILGIVAAVSAELPSCLEVARNPAVVNATMNFMINTKECQSDADCSGLEGGPMVCPPKMKVCMPTMMAERMANPTECQGINATTGVKKPDCVSGFRLNAATKQCEFRGPMLCTADGDCATGQKCLEPKSQPFKSKRCYTPCDPEAERVAEANDWETECGMTRHTPKGDKKTRMQKFVGCEKSDKVCGLKQPRDKLVRMVKANRDAFIPKDPAVAV